MTTPATRELRANWLLMLTCAIGMSLPSITIYSIGLFFEPLEGEFGWSRGEISFGLTIYSLVVAPLAPVAGALMDKWGARRVAIPGIIAFGLVFSSFALVTANIYSWWAIWVMIALVKLWITPTVWLLAISGHFKAARGTAMAVTLSGTAIASFLSPVIARYLIAEYGWQLAYVIMGLGWSGIVLVLVVPFFYDARDRRRQAENRGLQVADAVEQDRGDLPGLTMREAVRNSAFIRICLASFFVAVFAIGTTVHFLPILTLREMSRETAAAVVGLAGLCAALGKIGSGILFDRFPAKPIAAFCLSLPLVPLAILALHPGGEAIAMAVAISVAVTLGFATGAELSVTAYLTTQFCGLKAFGKNYGIIAAIIAIAAGFGPFIGGTIYDRTGDYMQMFYLGIPAALLSGLFIVTLPKPPEWGEPAA